MPYVDRHLLDGEVVTFRTRKHWNVYMVPALFAAFVCVPLAVVAARSTVRVWVVAPIAAALMLLLVARIKRGGSEFAVTNKRVLFKEGVLSTRSIELLLAKVEAITVTQGLMGKMLGYGEIVITGSGGTHESFADIQAPFDFRRAVQAATDAKP